MATLVQIYEVRSPKEAAALAGLGVDHIGVLVGKGNFPREQSYSRTRQIFAGVPATAKKLSLSLAYDIQQLAEVVKQTRPDILHLGTRPDTLPPGTIRKLKEAFPDVQMMRTIPVRNATDIALARHYEGIADFLLLDTWKSGAPEIGACGVAHDWSISRAIVERVTMPVILVGGIGPENAFDAVRTVHPAGVDSKTKTDLPDGSAKDLNKVLAMIQAVQQAEEICARE